MIRPNFDSSNPISMSDFAIASAPAANASSKHDLADIFAAQQQHQYTVARTSATERIAKLQRLHDVVLRNRAAIQEAMRLDFRKSTMETDFTETGVIANALRHAMHHLRSWMMPRSVATPMTLIGSFSEIRYQPKGVCLLISPWNFPFNLTLAPLALAVAAGNCVIIKPSEYTPHSAALMGKMIAECFPPEEVVLLEGDATLAQQLLELPFNHIFFTGSPAVGKIVMTAAAQHLSSVTLELGGKSPVIVDETADLDNAANKIAWINCMNAGQICIAPDYVLVHETVHAALVERIALKIKAFYGETPAARRETSDYCRMVNTKHFKRVRHLLEDAVQQGGKVSFGGGLDEATNYIEPTILTGVPDGAAIWAEEIFGPLLPIRTYRTPEEAIAYINKGPSPLALYIFSRKNRNIEAFIAETRSGGVAVNDCAAHFYNNNLPFGGVNNSGIGKSHGEFGFQEFSNPRGILRQNGLKPITDLFLPPYKSRLANLLLEGVVKWF